MGLFSRKSSGQEYAAFHAEVRADQERRERQAEAVAREAAQREAKWDRVVKNMTARGEDHTGRDLAIRNRTRAQGDRAAAETEQLTIKAARSNYRR
jgi:hypothetical protein